MCARLEDSHGSKTAGFRGARLVHGTGRGEAAGVTLVYWASQDLLTWALAPANSRGSIASAVICILVECAGGERMVVAAGTAGVAWCQPRAGWFARCNRMELIRMLGILLGCHFPPFWLERLAGA